MRALSLTLMALAVLAARPQAAGAGGPPKDWEKWVPESATAVLAIDVEALYRSPLAAREKWAARHAAGTPTDVTSLPEGVSGLVIASDLSPRALDDTWRVGMVQMSRATTAEDLARREGGRLDTVRGQTVVVTPRDLVFVPVSPTHLAARQPADRQALGRWIESNRQGKSAGPSVYLRQAVAYNRAPVVAALDLADAIDVEALRPRLKGVPGLAGRPAAEVDAVARLLAGLRGLMLTVRVTDTIDAEIRLDFDGPADAIKPYVLTLLREAMKAAGAELDDLADWSARVEGATATLSGKLSEQSLRLALSPFFPPAAVGSPGPTSAGAAPSGPDPKLAATLTYYRGLTSLVDQLRTMKGLSMETRGRWYREYARKVDALPVLHVDEDLLKLGTGIASTFRSLSNVSSNLTNQQTLIEMQRGGGLAQTGSVGAYGYGYDRFGRAVGVGYSAPTYAAVTNDPTVNTALMASATTEGAIRAGTWTNINTALGEMRKKLTLKYQVEFPAPDEVAPKKK